MVSTYQYRPRKQLVLQLMCKLDAQSCRQSDLPFVFEDLHVEPNACYSISAADPWKITRVKTQNVCAAKLEHYYSNCIIVLPLRFRYPLCKESTWLLKGRRQFTTQKQIIFHQSFENNAHKLAEIHPWYQFFESIKRSLKPKMQQLTLVFLGVNSPCLTPDQIRWEFHLVHLSRQMPPIPYLWLHCLQKWVLQFCHAFAQYHAWPPHFQFFQCRQRLCPFL